VGVEALAGASGVAATDLLPEGQVRVRGELWQAVCDEGARAGESVVVESVSGLTLQVRRK
jgi:membrane-bound serine protease (ClpP class)